MELKENLKEYNIHKSYHAMFSKLESNNLFDEMASAYLLFRTNKSKINNNLCFDQYFSDIDVIKFSDIQRFCDLIDAVILEQKANKVIKRYIPLKRRKFFTQNPENLILLKQVLRDIDLHIVKKYFSNNIAHESDENVQRFLNYMLDDYSTHRYEKISTSENFKHRERILFLNEDEALLYPDDNVNTFYQLGSQYWCCSFKSNSVLYSLNLFEKIYIYHDFNLEYHDENSVIALLVDQNNNIINLFNKYNFIIEDKNKIEHFQNMIDKENPNDLNQLHFSLNNLNKAFLSLRENNVEEAISQIRKYNFSMDITDSKNFHYLLPKVLETSSLKEINSLFRTKDNQSTLVGIKRPNNTLISNALQFEVEAYKSASPRIFLDYSKKNPKSEFLSEEHQLKTINLILNDKTIPSHDIFEFSLVNLYYSSQNSEKEQITKIISNYIQSVLELTTIEDFEQKLVSNFRKHSPIDFYESSFSLFFITFKMFYLISQDNLHYKKLEKIFFELSEILKNESHSFVGDSHMSIELRVLSLMNRFVNVKDSDSMSQFTLFIIDSVLSEKYLINNEAHMYTDFFILSDNKYFNHSFTKELMNILALKLNKETLTQTELKNKKDILNIYTQCFKYLDKDEIEDLLLSIEKERTKNTIKKLILNKKADDA